MAISDVQTKLSWYYVIDSCGKKSATLATSIVDLMGIGIDFIKLQKGSWYYSITLNHYYALSDARACAKLFQIHLQK
jgi:hypothetical protein